MTAAERGCQICEDTNADFPVDLDQGEAKAVALAQEQSTDLTF